MMFLAAASISFTAASAVGATADFEDPCSNSSASAGWLPLAAAASVLSGAPVRLASGVRGGCAARFGAPATRRRPSVAAMDWVGVAAALAAAVGWAAGAAPDERGCAVVAGDSVVAPGGGTAMVCAASVIAAAASAAGAGRGTLPSGGVLAADAAETGALAGSATGVCAVV